MKSFGYPHLQIEFSGDNIGRKMCFSKPMQHRIIHLTKNIRRCLTLLHSVFETHDMLNNFRA